MYKQIIGFTLLAFVAVTFAEEVYWRDCGSTLATVHEVRLTNCSHVPCQITRGILYEIEIDATSHTWSPSFPFNVTAQVLAFPILILEGDVCDFLIDGECPIDHGDRLTFWENINIPTGVPPITTTAISQVWTYDYRRAICVEIPVQLV